MVQPQPKSFEDWQNEALSRVLRISLNDEAAKSSPHRPLFLRDLARELEAEEPEGRPLRLTSAMADRALVARLSLEPAEYKDSVPPAEQVAFDYLVACWKRAMEIRQGTASRAAKIADASQRIKVLDEVRALVVSYAGLALQYPDTFPQDSSRAGQFGPLQMLPYMQADADSPVGFPAGLLEELVTRFKDDGLEELFGPVLTGVSALMRTQTVLTDFRTPLRIMTTLLEHQPIAAMITTLPNWNPPGTNAKTIELVSIMGPFLRLSLYPTDDPMIGEAFFSSKESRSRGDIESAITSLRGSFAFIQSALFNIFNLIVRASPQSRQNVLSYFGTVIARNAKRAQMQVDRQVVSGDGFVTNIGAVLLSFSFGFIDVGYTKISKIDPDYLRLHPDRINVRDDTKMFADQEESDNYYNATAAEEGAKNPPNFITECFFLTAAALHYGFLRSFVLYTRFIDDLRHLKREYDTLKAEQPRWASTPQAAMNENLMSRMEAHLKKASSQKLALDAQILYPSFLSQCLRFLNLAATWMVRIASCREDGPSAGDYPASPVVLPLNQQPSMRWKCLPEWFAEDVTEFFLFLARYSPMTIMSGSRDELVDFLIVFLRSPAYIKNPYLRAKFVEIIFDFTLPFPGEPEGGLGAHLNAQPLCVEHLVPAVMRFYVEVEQTGAHSQFYDKFNIRYNISQILKAVWRNPAHREKVREESRDSVSFVRFVNLLTNDTTYLLDESLAKLKEINSIQTEMDDQGWASKTEQYRKEREDLLRTDERQAASYVAFGNETVHMLNYLTADIVDPFMTPEIVDRLSSMLDYNLAGMVGPKRANLKVKNPEKYRFQPKALLKELLQIYLHLAHRHEFILAVARDGRSYSKTWFSMAAAIMLNNNLMPKDDIDRLEKFVGDVEAAIISDLQTEEELGEAPEEFLDPLMYTVMEDPVILPTSNVSIDRSTIKSHLLSDSTDPFNRKPLTIDMVIPDTQLKARILEWKAKKKAHPSSG